MNSDEAELIPSTIPTVSENERDLSVDIETFSQNKFNIILNTAKFLALLGSDRHRDKAAAFARNIGDSELDFGDNGVYNFVDVPPLRVWLASDIGYTDCKIIFDLMLKRGAMPYLLANSESLLISACSPTTTWNAAQLLFWVAPPLPITRAVLNAACNSNNLQFTELAISRLPPAELNGVLHMVLEKRMWSLANTVIRKAPSADLEWNDPECVRAIVLLRSFANVNANDDEERMVVLAHLTTAVKFLKLFHSATIRSLRWELFHVLLPALLTVIGLYLSSP